MMIAAAVLPLLLAAASAPPTAEDLGDGRFRITVTFRGGSLERHVDAQMQIQRHAARVCRGRGAPVSAGSLELNGVPGSNRLGLTETWTCRQR